MAQNYVVHIKQSYVPTFLNAVISAINTSVMFFENPIIQNVPNILYELMKTTLFTKEQIHLLLKTHEVRLHVYHF